MGYKMTLQDCVDLATFAHRHQYDKAGEPYIKHPLRVMENVQAQGARAFVQMAAVLHDVTEDTPFTPRMLIDLGVPEAAVDIVRLVDRGESKVAFYGAGADVTGSYHSFGAQVVEQKDIDAFYYRGIKLNPGAVQVKKADIGDNTQPWRLEYLDPETQVRLRAKYAKALEQLA